jgi:hypothetical protein
MGAAAYRRGSRAISRQIDRELAERRQICGGTYRDGPNKNYSYCDRCGRIDYEKYEGDKCTMPPKGAWPRDNPRLTPDITVRGLMPTKLEYEKSLALLHSMPMPSTTQLDDVDQTVLIELHRQGLVRTRERGGLYNNELVLTEYGKLYLSQRMKNNPAWSKVFG